MQIFENLVARLVILTICLAAALSLCTVLRREPPRLEGGTPTNGQVLPHLVWFA